jgi:hypothetical protein
LYLTHDTFSDTPVGMTTDAEVTCLECGETFAMLRWMHLKKHGLTAASYLARHPGAVLVPPGRRLTGARNPARLPGVAARISRGRAGITSETSPAIAADAARRRGPRLPPRDPSLCAIRSCDGSAESGKRLCGVHLAEMAARQDVIRERRRAAGFCPVCGKVPPEEGKKNCRACITQKVQSMTPERKHAEHVERWASLKDAAYAAYGGYTCACCGETTKAFLTIDHVNNDGAEHRKTVSPSRLYTWLRNHQYPEGFQVLCMNCNFGKARNGGVCPHQVNEGG